MEKIELLGSACFSHGPYTFYKAVRISNGRILRLGSFFLTKLWSDADLVSIGELQLLWIDSRGPNTPLASLRLYFLPENTPDGRRDTHGEDEVLTISEKVVVRVHDLVTWLSPSLEWSWGREVEIPWTPSSSPESSPRGPEIAQPQVLTDPGIDFSDVEKQQKEFESNMNCVKKQDNQSRVVVLSYPRYCRYRALLRRLEGSEPSWLASSVAAALGGFTALPGTRVLFCRDTFDYPDLETHELLCNHLAPKLKGRPRRKRKKRSVSPGESSNESEASVASTSKSVVTSSNQSVSIGRFANVRRSDRKTTAEEKKFLADVQNFMNSRGTPVGKTPLLGYRQIDLYLFYSKVQTLGGYESVSAGRLWKTVYDDIGGNTASTSAATITRRHYERLLLPYERYQRGEDAKVKPIQGRRTKTSSTSEDSMAETMIKQEPENNYPREFSPSIASEPMSNCNLNSSIHSNHFTSIMPPVQSILATTPFLPGDKPRSDPGKTSSLRSVRVKPDRLKSLNTMIAGSTAPLSQPPSPPLSSNTSTSTPSSTPSTTPTNGSSQTALERQLNASPLMSHQVAPSSSPSTPPTVVTLTPPPEKDMKDIKLDAKQTNLIAQGKENIPLYDEKPLYIEKVVAPRSPEVIDLESEEKLIIPSFKKRKLEILREGGLEVTAVELDSRPSVIQPHATAPQSNAKVEEKVATTTPPASTPKLISVTVTPDIGHMLPSRANNNVAVSNSNVSHNSTATNSRVINVGNSGNALLQLYATAGVTRRFPASTPPVPMSDRQVPPRVTQGRSIFSHNEKTVYGNPKEILAVPNKYPSASSGVNLVRTENPPHLPGGVLDLTQKQAFSRPNLEIVRVPVLSRPSPLNLDTKSSQNSRDKPASHFPPPPMEAPPRKNHYPPAATYTNVLDSRTMASNNLEITLVSPKKGSPAPIRPNSVGPAGTMSPHRKTPQPLINDKYAGISRSEPVSPYTPRKNSHPVVIPNVPNLSQLNNAGAYARNTASSMNLDKRKGESSRDHHRRTSEGEKMVSPHDNLRRHSMPSAFVPPGVMANGPGAFLAPPPPGPLPTNSPNKFLPMIDPMYYSAFYNGLLPSPMVAAAAAANPFLPPEFSAYYKELLAPSQSRLAIGQSPTVPTSK